MECSGKLITFTPKGSDCPTEDTPVPGCATAEECDGGTTVAKCPVSCDMFPKGVLVDTTKCSGKAIQTFQVEGEMELMADKCVPAAAAKGGLAKAFEFSEAEETLIDAEVACDERRLSSDGERRLEKHQTKKSKISYTILLPEGKSVEHIKSKIKEINDGGDAQGAFVKHIEKEADMSVDTSTIKAPAPTKVTSVMITVNKDGSLGEKPVKLSDVIKATKDAKKPAPASEEEGGNVGAIVGGIIGALVGVAIIGGLAYYFLVVKKKSEQ